MTQQKEIDRITERIGWLACECGKEDAHIRRLKEELEARTRRRDAMWKASDRLMKKLEKMGVIAPKEEREGE